jgi:hypothetical protein
LGRAREGKGRSRQGRQLRRLARTPSARNGDAGALTSPDDLEQFADNVKLRPNNGVAVPHRGVKASTFLPPHGFVHREEAARPKAIAVPQPAIEPAPVATPQFQDAEVACYSEMMARLRDRVGQLGVRYLDFDKLAGWAEGMSGKAFGQAQIKRLGSDKLFDAIRAAGLRLRIEEDPEQTAKMKARIEQNFLPRQGNQARMGNRSNLSTKTIDDVLSYLANKKGGLTTLNLAVKRARSNLSRQAGKESAALPISLRTRRASDPRIP